MSRTKIDGPTDAELIQQWRIACRETQARSLALRQMTDLRDGLEAEINRRGIDLRTMPAVPTPPAREATAENDPHPTTSPHL